MQEIPAFLIVYREKVVFVILDFNTWEIINIAYSTTLTPFSSWGTFLLPKLCIEQKFAPRPKKPWMSGAVERICEVSWASLKWSLLGLSDLVFWLMLIKSFRDCSLNFISNDKFYNSIRSSIGYILTARIHDLFLRKSLAYWNYRKG